VEETARVLQAARDTGALLWEAFVFPFHAQMQRVRQLLGEGQIGELEEIQSSWHFLVRDRQNIRLSPDLAGGALNDVGCYCLHLGSQLFTADPTAAAGLARLAPEGVDEESHAAVLYPGNRFLTLSCGLRRPYIDTFTRVLGSRGEIRLSHAYHPRPHDTVELRTGERTVIERPTGPDPSFTPAIRHIHAAIGGREEPRHLAVSDAMRTAVGLELVRRSLGLTRAG
jgi:predicted dehydrogenase